MPQLFDPAKYETFIQAVEEGETVKTACQRSTVAWRTVSRWIADDANVTLDGEPAGARYARARSVSAELWADKAVTAAEDARDKDDAQVARVKVDVYKWRAAMANPKEYGERRNVEVSGSVSHLHLDALRALNAKPHVTARIASGDDTQPVTAQDDTPLPGTA
jgi:hypothetical protein